MKLEQQVVSLELAKKLKELGVKQESYFSWMTGVMSSWDEEEQASVRKNTISLIANLANDTNTYSAFTVAELGIVLPDNCESYRYQEPDYKRWFCRWFVEGDKLHYKALEDADTEADARAKMLIYLIENNLWSPNTQE